MLGQTNDGVAQIALLGLYKQVAEAHPAGQLEGIYATSPGVAAMELCWLVLAINLTQHRISWGKGFLRNYLDQLGLWGFS